MAKKATRVRYNGIAPYIDDTQANRVQALGSSSRLTMEDMKELGTLNIVEIVDDVPQVDVSVDQNENGTNDLLGLFSNKGYGLNVVAVPNTATSAVGTLQVKVLPGSYYAGGVDGNRILFLGTTLTIVADATAGTDMFVFVKAEITEGLKVAFAKTLPAGAIKIATLKGIAIDAGVIKQADITDNRPFKTLTEVDFELAKVDIFVPVRQTGDGSVIKRTMYMERVFLNNVDFSFQVNGVATASYRLETDNKRWFLNSSAQVVVNEYKYTTGTITLTQTPNPLANGNKLLKLKVNGVEKKEGTDFTVATNIVTFTTVPTAGDMIKVRYVSATGGSFFAPTPAVEDPHPQLAGGIKEGQVELYLVDKNGVVDAERTTRVQSARIGVPLTREALDELGSSYPYDRPMQLPINSTISLELKDSDLELMARLAGYANLNTVTEIALDDLVKNMGLLVKIYRENDIKRAKLPAGHPDKYAVKTLYVRNLIPQSEAWDVRVDSDATQNFEFMAHNITISDEIK
jgi:hypothetical protein